MKTETILKTVNEVLSTSDFGKLSKLKLDLEDDIRVQGCKNKGLKLDSAIKKIIKDSPFGMIYVPYKGKRALLNNYMMLCLNDNYGYLKIEDTHLEPIDLGKAIPSTEKYSYQIDVDMNDLEAFNKISKAEASKRPYIMECRDLKIGVNSNKLLTILKAMKTNTVYCKDCVSPILTEIDIDHNEFGMVLPMRIM
jgi:hypothetical protein